MFKRNKNSYYFFYVYYVTQKTTNQEHLKHENLQKMILSLMEILLYLIKKCITITLLLLMPLLLCIYESVITLR